MKLPDIVRKDVYEVITGVREAIKDQNAPRIKELSSHTIHNASIFQDDFSISIATAIYSLAKILENERVKRQYPKEWQKFLNDVNKALDDIAACASNKECLGLDEKIKELVKLIAAFDERFTEYVGFVMQKAKIKKGVEIYKHGISLSRVADVLGISVWELMDYVGKTKVNEVPSKTSIKDRFETAKRFFE